MEPKVGQCYYAPRGRGFRIYCWEFVSAASCSATPLPGEPMYYDREEARRRVYQLNGWGEPRASLRGN